MNADSDESHLRTKNIIYLKGIVHHHKITIMLLLTPTWFQTCITSFRVGLVRTFLEDLTLQRD